MIILIILLLIYVLSTIGAYNIIRKVFSKGGKWESLNPEPIDLYFNFFPIVNTMLVIMYTCDKINFNFNFSLTKFYRIKK